MQTTIHKGVIHDKRWSYAERPKPFSDGLGYQSVSFVGCNGLCGPFFATSGISKELEKAIAFRSPVELEIGEVYIPNAGRPLVALKVDGKAYAMRPVQGPGIVAFWCFQALNLTFWIVGLLTLPFLVGAVVLYFAWLGRKVVRENREALSTLNNHLASLRGAVEFV